MEYLKLGLLGMSAAEASLVGTLFRLHRVEPSFIWDLGSEPPYDALLVDEACASEQIESLKSPGTKVMRLGSIDSAVPGTMPRPIRSDLLVRWLNSIEVEILHSSRDPFASTSIESQHSRSRLAPRKQTAVTHPGASQMVSSELFPPGTRVKLRRWPAGGLLAGDVNRIRMATMISRRALSLQELAMATRVPPEQCAAFVQLLREADLLESSSPSDVAPPAPVPTLVQPSLDLPKARGIGRSLLQSIRLRFGL